MTRVLIADDHPAFRRGVALMLVGVEDLDVVGGADTGQRAVDLSAELAPDVVLMDLRMPDLDGIEATRQINRGEHAPAVVVLTMFEDDDSVFAAMRAGARGYLLKGADQEEIVRAIRAAAAGEAIFGPEIAARVISHFATGPGSTSSAFPSLTEREREVLEMIAAGKGNATIAHQLVISLKTVRNHVSNIFTKLQVSDRSAAIIKARKWGWAAGRTTALTERSSRMRAVPPRWRRFVRAQLSGQTSLRGTSRGAAGGASLLPRGAPPRTSLATGC